ncbi:unnamed protein product [Lota lota]
MDVLGRQSVLSLVLSVLTGRFCSASQTLRWAARDCSSPPERGTTTLFGQKMWISSFDFNATISVTCSCYSKRESAIELQA